MPWCIEYAVAFLLRFWCKLLKCGYFQARYTMGFAASFKFGPKFRSRSRRSVHRSFILMISSFIQANSTSQINPGFRIHGLGSFIIYELNVYWENMKPKIKNNSEEAWSKKIKKCFEYETEGLQKITNGRRLKLSPTLLGAEVTVTNTVALDRQYYTHIKI